MRTIINLYLSIAVFGCLFAERLPVQTQSVVIQDEDRKEPTPIAETPKAFAVAVQSIEAFRAPKGDQINANGNQYFVVDEAPEKVDAVLIFTEGDHKNWIVVRKVSGGKSVKLIPFSKNQFLFEHSGLGEYEVTSLDEKNEPVFDYFEVENEDPQDPGQPKPPVGDFSKLIETAKANANNDLETRKKLGQAWQAAIASSKDVAELKKKIGQARADVLSLVRDQDGSWNKWLLSIDEWFRSNPNVNYSLAMKALTQWMVN